MKDYTWAVNKLKLERAIKNFGEDATESLIKEYYIKLGGLVAPEKIRATAPIIEQPKEEIKVEKPKRNVKTSK